MKTLTRVAATTAATLALVGSTVALTAAPADAASKGTVTKTDGQQPSYENDRRFCGCRP